MEPNQPPVRFEEDGVPLETNLSDVVNESVVDDLDPVEPDPAYFAPEDPVLTRTDAGDIAVLNGFAADALDEDEPERSSDGTIGDEGLADAVREELQRDSATTDLPIRVTVRQGQVRLTGQVPTLDDANNAEAVAGRVPGVADVIEDLRVQSLTTPPKL